MPDQHELEFFVSVNEDGDSEVDFNATDARDRLIENSGGMSIRTVKVRMTITLPEADEEVEVDVPDSAGTTEKIEVEAA